MRITSLLTEMAAKKYCEKCGKTMAANHYWYKGAWKCKGASKVPQDGQQPAPTAQPKPAASPVSKPSISLETIRQAVPEAGNEPSGRQLGWSVREYQGNIYVDFEYTFRRMSRVGAYKDNSSRLDSANKRLQQIASQYPDNVVKLSLCTLDSARRGDEWAEGNGDSAYSEYEQAIGGELVLKIS